MDFWAAVVSHVGPGLGLQASASGSSLCSTWRVSRVAGWTSVRAPRPRDRSDARKDETQHGNPT